jgi:hypothetical protein
VANYRTEYLFDFLDTNGDHAEMKLTGWVADTVALSALAASATNIAQLIGAPGHVSNAEVVGARVRLRFLTAQGPGSGSNPPLDAWYPNVVHKARLLYGNANQARQRISLPAPIAGLFQSPPAGDVVNVANAHLGTFSTAVEGFAQDAGGNALNLYLGGTYRTGRPRVRKVA